MRVKICGITNREDALCAVAHGAWAIGFVFYEYSPRYITINQAASIGKLLPYNVERIGVFVNPDREYLERSISVAGLTAVQLHGDESVEDYHGISVPIIKGLRLSKVLDLQHSKNYRNCQYLLLDAADGDHYGGTGKVGNWSLAKQATGFAKIILAGGLNEGNVERAIQEVKPYALDLSSGVERYPGRKCHIKMARFFQRLNNRIADFGEQPHAKASY